MLDALSETAYIVSGSSTDTTYTFLYKLYTQSKSYHFIKSKCNSTLGFGFSFTDVLKVKFIIDLQMIKTILS